ncbi:uncharacterized protein LOC117121429, partial [Anneissia japonica]|uniref:uncharacterized protein LOC117121429 n=1 Tax=Anneissia japonica TaxID=1529436 RepID=UPI0014259673
MTGMNSALKNELEECPISSAKILNTALEKIKKKHTPVFETFAKVHTLINHTRPVNPTELREYESAITDFSREYRKVATNVKQPKLHMLEHHSIEFMRKWKVGLGLLSEQGGELIHAEFNRRKRSVYGLRSHLDQIMSVMISHL